MSVAGYVQCVPSWLKYLQTHCTISREGEEYQTNPGNNQRIVAPWQGQVGKAFYSGSGLTFKGDRNTL